MGYNVYRQKTRELKPPQILTIPLPTIIAGYLIMNLTSFIQLFDFFATCYVYGSIAYVFLLFVTGLALNLLTSVEQERVGKSDFYSEVKELLNPPDNSDFEPPLQPDFATMTIRELRTFIRDNELQESVYTCLGKTVSNACKHELITALS